MRWPTANEPGGIATWGGEAGTLEEALAVLDRQHAKGVDLIKIMATGAVTPNTSWRRPIRSTHYESCCESCSRLRYEIAAHCHGVDGIGMPRMRV